MSPRSGNPIFFCSSQQLNYLDLGDPWRAFGTDTVPFKGPHPCLKGCLLLWELQRYKDTVKWTAAFKTTYGNCFHWFNKKRGLGTPYPPPPRFSTAETTVLASLYSRGAVHFDFPSSVPKRRSGELVRRCVTTSIQYKGDSTIAYCIHMFAWWWRSLLENK